jgi:hypothetical protein
MLAVPVCDRDAEKEMLALALWLLDAVHEGVPVGERVCSGRAWGGSNCTPAWEGDLRVV